MSDYVKGVQVGDKVKKYDYESLANKPDLLGLDTTLKVGGKAADAQVVGQRFETQDEKFTEIKNDVDGINEDIEDINDTLTELDTAFDGANESIRSLTNGVRNTFANALKGSATGAVVRVNDVSPVEHEVTTTVTIPDGTDISTVNVLVCGKNLIPFPYPMLNDTLEINGLTVTVRSDGGVCINGVSTTVTYVNLCKIDFGNKSIIPNHDEFTDYSVYSSAYISNKGDGWKTWYDRANNVTFIEVASGTYSNLVIYPQIENGSASTEYEMGTFNKIYKPNSNGTVTDVKSISPNMTILTNVDNVVIDVSYSQDTRAIINKLVSAIEALGGTV